MFPKFDKDISAGGKTVYLEIHFHNDYERRRRKREEEDDEYDEDEEDDEYEDDDDDEDDEYYEYDDAEDKKAWVYITSEDNAYGVINQRWFDGHVFKFHLVRNEQPVVMLDNVNQYDYLDCSDESFYKCLAQQMEVPSFIIILHHFYRDPSVKIF